MTGRPIRVLLAEDQGMMRGALALLLGMEDDIEVVKDGPLEELAAAIRRVLAGETVVDPALATAALSAGPNPLTSRESDALKASADGATVADIAARLHLSESTVRNYLSSAIGKTGTRNRMEALREARGQGWL
ncbi:hypothetical protein GCM10010304_69840 [Streptomyces roseoviolaceus]